MCRPQVLPPLEETVHQLKFGCFLSSGLSSNLSGKMDPDQGQIELASMISNPIPPPYLRRAVRERAGLGHTRDSIAIQ
jgi:hypothetical protein